jgi:hypothetical protein
MILQDMQLSCAINQEIDRCYWMNTIARQEKNVDILVLLDKSYGTAGKTDVTMIRHIFCGAVGFLACSCGPYVRMWDFCFREQWNISQPKEDKS